MQDDLLSEACDGIYIDEEGRAKVKDTHIENLATLRLADIVERLLDNPNITLVSKNPIKLKWDERKKQYI
jgi:hypothetical protein